MAEKLSEETWKRYEEEFNTLTDEEIAEETSYCLGEVVEVQDWLDALASWNAAGRPRRAVLSDQT